MNLRGPQFDLLGHQQALKLIQLVDEKLVSGWDDPRMVMLGYFVIPVLCANVRRRSRTHADHEYRAWTMRGSSHPLTSFSIDELDQFALADDRVGQMSRANSY